MMKRRRKGSAAVPDGADGEDGGDARTSKRRKRGSGTEEHPVHSAPSDCVSEGEQPVEMQVEEEGADEDVASAAPLQVADASESRSAATPVCVPPPLGASPLAAIARMETQGSPSDGGAGATELPGAALRYIPSMAAGPPIAQPGSVVIRTELTDHCRGVACAVERFDVLPALTSLDAREQKLVARRERCMEECSELEVRLHDLMVQIHTLEKEKQAVASVRDGVMQRVGKIDEKLKTLRHQRIAHHDKLRTDVEAVERVKQMQSSTVRLNVGGVMYETSVHTLRKVPGSMLEAMFSGRHGLPAGSDGAVFIDRDGALFRYVLNFLRDGELDVPEDRRGTYWERQLKRELSFFGLLPFTSRHIFAIGGADQYTLNSVERFDVESGVWSSVSPMRIPRCGPAACAIGNVMYVVGGENELHQRLNTLEFFVGATEQWSTGQPMRAARCAHGAAPIGRKIYVVGGSGQDHRTLASMEVYDTHTDEWKSAAPMRSKRCAHAVCSTGKSLFAIGGEDDAQVLGTVEEYDIECDSWHVRRSMMTRRCGHAVCCHEGRIYVFGGQDNERNKLSSVECYDIATDTWSMVANMGSKRWGLAAACCANHAYVVGGMDENGELLSSAEQYEFSTNTWTPLHRMVTKRWFHSMCSITL